MFSNIRSAETDGTDQANANSMRCTVQRSPHLVFTYLPALSCSVRMWFSPPEHESFLRKVQLEGDFGIAGGEFTSPHTQGKIEELSARARSKKKADQHAEESERTLSDLKGHVILRHGTATFSNASFRVPGALARMQGTYNLTTERIDLQGTLAIQASLSQAAGGVKSILLKPLNPFFRKAHAGAVIPVQITGTYSHPLFHVSLVRKVKHHRS